MLHSDNKPGGASYGSAFLGPVSHTLSVLVPIASLTIAEVDANGCIKPGVPLKENGTLANGAAGEFIFGAVVEATRIVGPNPTAASLAANTGTVPVTVGVIGIYNRGAAAFNMGRALTPAEIAAFRAAGCKLVLSRAVVA